jgi:hypothetical protein
MEDNTLHDILLLLLMSLIVVFIYAPPITNTGSTGNTKIINTPVFDISLPDIYYKYMFGSVEPKYTISNFGNAYDNFMQ